MMWPLERWLSGRKHVPAKDAYPVKGIEGSTPSLSIFFSENLAHVQQLRNLMPTTGCGNADMQVLIETAIAAECVNSDMACAILAEAKTLAKALVNQLGTSPQTVVDALAKILKVEACIDKDRAGSSLCFLKKEIAHLPTLLKAYADVRIAQIELCMGLEHAKETLQQSEQIFFQQAEEQKQQIIQDPSGTRRLGWGNSKSKDLINIAWLEALVDLEKAKKTILVAAHESSVREFMGEMTSYILIQNGAAGFNPQQTEAYSQLLFTGMKLLLKLPADRMEEVLESVKVQPENLEEAKQAALLMDLSMQKCLKLIEIAQVEAALNVDRARATLALVEALVLKIEKPAFAIIALVKQILRT